MRHSLAQAVTGIYCGWSSLGDNSKVGPKPCLLLLALQVSVTCMCVEIISSLIGT